MRRINNRIEYREVGRYHVNEIVERYNYDWDGTENPYWAKVIFHTAYVICNVYTDKDTVLETFLKVNGETATKKIALNKTNERFDFSTEQNIISQVVHNDFYNCHGYTFLDGQFWFELSATTVKMILDDDGYVRCEKKNLKENGVCLYYNKYGALIHSAKMVDGSIISKFGINNILTYSEKEILAKYKTVEPTMTAYYNPRLTFQDFR